MKRSNHQSQDGSAASSVNISGVSSAKRRPPNRPIDVVRFPHWSVYFDGASEIYSDDHELAPAINAFTTYFFTIIDKYATEKKPIKPSLRVIAISYADLQSQCQLQDLSERLKLDPESVLASLGLAFSNALIEKFGDVVKRLKRHVRILGHDQITPLKDLKSNLMGRFITIRGTIVRVSSIKPIVTRISFSCTSCSATQVILQIDGKYKTPTSCPGDGCRGRTFVPERSGLSDTKTVDWQRIRVQEKLPEDQKDSGRIPRTVECELTEDLVDLIVPGDV
ncbi:DNA replication licensing factor mcm8, partial [Physocladia obscura]